MSMKKPKSNFVNEEINPCIEEYNLTTKCMDENYYEQEKCTHYFKNYKVCKKFWGKVTEARKLKGIKPHLPGSEERQKILKEVDETNKFVYAAD